MNWKRGLLLAGINLTVAIPLILWAESQDAAFVRQHYVPAVPSTKSSPPLAGPASSEKDEGVTFNPCGMTDQYSVQEEVVLFANMPVQIPIDWAESVPSALVTLWNVAR